LIIISRHFAIARHTPLPASLMSFLISITPYFHFAPLLIASLQAAFAIAAPFHAADADLLSLSRADAAHFRTPRVIIFSLR